MKHCIKKIIFWIFRSWINEEIRIKADELWKHERPYRLETMMKNYVDELNINDLENCD